ncbi:MAG: MATE family efflux transporter, partial [Candidatus Hydrothermarchaeales archaeon]
LEVISMGASYLLMVALTYAFIGISIIVGGAFQGSGDAIPGLVITSIRLWIIAVPGAYLLSKISGYGVGGIWLAIAISNVVAGFISVLWLRFGRWE